MPRAKHGESGVQAESRKANQPNRPEMARRTESPPNLPEIYANGFQVAVGPLDIRIYLIESIPISQTEVVDKRLFCIIMTPETLKLLADNLPAFVELYERQFGKLRKLRTTPAPMVVKA